MDITQIAVALIGLCGLIITGVVIPYIRTKCTAEQWETVKNWTATAVAAAEVLFKGAGRGSDKAAYVLDYVQKMCAEKGVKFDEASVRVALENAWRGLSDGKQANIAQNVSAPVPPASLKV